MICIITRSELETSGSIIVQGHIDCSDSNIDTANSISKGTYCNQWHEKRGCNKRKPKFLSPSPETDSCTRSVPSTESAKSRQGEDGHRGRSCSVAARANNEYVLCVTIFSIVASLRRSRVLCEH